MPERVLECSTLGDKRFSPFFARVRAFGREDSIEQFYQRSKVFVAGGGELLPALDWQDAKRKQRPKPRGLGLPLFSEFLLPDGRWCPLEFHVFGWYTSLWLKYLDNHPELVEFAKTFDDYRDTFKGEFPFCQADCVRKYVKEGRAALLDTCRDFLAWLRSEA